MDLDIYNEFFRKTIAIAKLLRTTARMNLASLNYTWEEFDILRTIKPDTEISVSEVASITGRQKSNIIPVLNIFEDKGFIKRLREPPDRRNVSIMLTEKGIEERKIVLGKQRAFIADFLSGLDVAAIKTLNMEYDVILKYLLENERHPDAKE